MIRAIILKKRERYDKMSIRSKYESELALVFNKMVGMCHAVELAIEKSITALRMRDTELEHVQNITGKNR